MGGHVFGHLLAPLPIGNFSLPQVGGRRFRCFPWAFPEAFARSLVPIHAAKQAAADLRRKQRKITGEPSFSRQMGNRLWPSAEHCARRPGNLFSRIEIGAGGLSSGLAPSVLSVVSVVWGTPLFQPLSFLPLITNQKPRTRARNRVPGTTDITDTVDGADQGGGRILSMESLGSGRNSPTIWAIFAQVVAKYINCGSLSRSWPAFRQGAVARLG
jgi:hypothetical protein